MKLTTFLVSAVLALGVAAIDPESGNDVEVRDFSGESLNEFDARSPEEEELEARDDEDLEARTYPTNPCKGSNVEYKKVGYSNKKECVCTRDGEIYGKDGCACKWGYEWVEKKHKCAKKCDHWEVRNPTTGECEKPFKCKGSNVEVVDNYGQKSCKCTLENQEYNKFRGCECKHGFEWSKHHNKCIPKCPYGTEYNGVKCAPKCKGDNVVYKNNECKCLKYGQYYDDKEGCKPRCIGYAWYKHGQCQCKPGDYYNDKLGCLPRCDGDAKWNGHECTCPYGKDYVKTKGCVDKCKTPAYFKKGECRCPSKDQEYNHVKGCVNRCDGDGKWNGHECTCDYGKKYVKGKGCVKTCKHPAKLFNDQCVCEGGQNYSEHKGCYCPHPKVWNVQYNKCTKKCGDHEKLVIKEGYGGYEKCVCVDGYYPTKWGCQKKKHGGY